MCVFSSFGLNNPPGRPPPHPPHPTLATSGFIGRSVRCVRRSKILGRDRGRVRDRDKHLEERGGWRASRCRRAMTPSRSGGTSWPSTSRAAAPHSARRRTFVPGGENEKRRTTKKLDFFLLLFFCPEDQSGLWMKYLVQADSARACMCSTRACIYSVVCGAVFRWYGVKVHTACHFCSRS